MRETSTSSSGRRYFFDKHPMRRRCRVAMVAVGGNGGRASRFRTALPVLHLLATLTIVQAFQLHPLLASQSSSIIPPLNAISRRQTFVIDGGELQSFLIYNNVANSKSSANLPPAQTQQYTNQRGRGHSMEQQVGLLTFVVGTTTIHNDDSSSKQCRVVGVEKNLNYNDNDDDENDKYETISLTDEVQIYKHTMATIPSNISDMDALSTAAATVVGVHCAIPKVEDIGGSGGVLAAQETNDNSNNIDTTIFYSGKAVILGGNDYAIFIANGLATLGIHVSLVTTAANSVTKRVTNKRVKVMSPSAVDTTSDSKNKINNKEVGFATIIGRFDSLIDTISNEKQGMTISDTTDDPAMGGKSNLFTLLQSRHQCNKYVSTMTHSQQLIITDGLLFGPGKVNSYVKSTMSYTPQGNNMNSNKCLNLIPSPGFGPSTLQVLLENNVIYSSNNKSDREPILIRKWEIQDFWEETSWPRDNSGTGVRYGLPVLSDDDDDDDEDEDKLDELLRNIDQPLSWAVKQQQQQQLGTRVGSVGGMDEQEVRKQTIVDNTNPYVTQIVGIDGLATQIIYPRRSSVVFVAMRSCRTCKSINTMYTKLARDRDTKGDTNILFAKADATGSTGRQLGKQLGIVAVPSFVLFRNGLRYGAVFTSKLPNDRLDQAIRDMEAGKDFDKSLEEEP